MISLITGAYGQQFGAFPPSFKWKQINTDTARIIFTPNARTEAQHIAGIIHKMAATHNQLGNKSGKINVVLHSHTTLANGYVALAPFRSEFYLIPGGNIFEFGNLPWPDQLAIHEYRHVQQYNNFNRGLSKAFGVVLGQEGRALANALSVPDWFFEGDAVYAETVLSPQGRGRMPYFFNGFNSLWKEGKEYSWMKLRNGSLKDYVPNHYQLGYLLTNYGYEKYGPDFWGKVTRDASSFKGLFYPFQKAIEKHAGITYRTFREEALNSYRKQITGKGAGTQPREVVAHYFFPQLVGRDSLVYLKISYKELPAFYLKTSGNEQRIKLRKISSEDWFSYRNGIIAYTSYSTHPRWPLINYSDITLLNTLTGREERITRQQKYFTPDLAPDAGSLVAVSVNDSLDYELHWMDRGGKIIQKIAAPERAALFNPRFLDSTSIVVGVRWANATMSLQKLDLSTGTFQELLGPTNASLGFPSVHQGVVYFVSSLSGNDDIYALQLQNLKLFRLTSGQTGHYFPSVYGDTLTWSAFTADGNRVEQKSLRDLTPTEVESFQKTTVPYPIAGTQSFSTSPAMERREFKSSTYKKSTGLLNVHSWRPNYEDPEFTFSLYSDNVLNTFSNELFYRYNENELSHAVGFNTAYAGLYPIITGGVEYIYNQHIGLGSRTITLDQSEVRVGYRLPFNLTQGKTVKSLSFGSDFVFGRLMPTGILKDSFRAQNTTYLHHFLNWGHQLPRARQHIYPKLGYAAGLHYRHRLDEPGYQVLGTGSIYLPAPFATHSLVMTGSVQQADTNNILFSNLFASSRGYPSYNITFRQTRAWRLSGNYHLPLVYPDWGFANLLYIQRVRANLFYDFTRVYSKDKRGSLDLRSTGTELFLDTRWWNQLPVSFGIRYSYLVDASRTGRQRSMFEFILPVGLIPD